MIRNCLARIGCLALLVIGGIAAGSGWLYHEELAAWWEAHSEEVVRWWEGRGAPELTGEPSREIADWAEEKVEEMLREDPPATTRLEEIEAQSLLRYRIGPQLPAGLTDPDVRLADSTAELSAAVRLRELMGEDSAENLRRLIGDSSRLTVRLAPEVPDPGTLHLRVLRLQAGAIVVPSLMLPWIVRELGETPPGDSRTLTYRIHPEVTDVRVEDRELILERGGAERRQ